jgi:hypothetical protein
MSITIKQLETLAAHFRFDMDEARQVIGIELKKRGRPKSPSSDSGSEKGHYKPKAEKEEKGHYKPKADKPVKEEKGHYKPKADKPVKEEKEKKARGPSGYNIFVREQGVSFRNAGGAWKALSDSERERWNAKAKA